MTDIFLKILSMSVTSAVVIGVIIMLRLPLKKAPKIFSYILWAAALFRLLCPFAFELPSAPVAPVSFETSERSEYEMLPNSLESPYPTFDVKDNNEVVIYTSESVNAPVYNKTKKAADFIAYFWAAGASAMIVCGLVSYFRLKKRLEGAKENNGIFLSEKINDPFIIGIIKPRIYLPVNLSEEESKLIILHEKTHMKRLDHIAKIIMYISLCIHWFNPLVWVMFRLFERDMEMSCDESAAAKLSENEKAAYSEALLKFSIKPAAAFTACFGESGTKQRIKNILGFRKPAVWVIIILALSVLTAVTVLSVNKRRENELSAILHNPEEYIFSVSIDEDIIRAKYDSMSAKYLDVLLSALKNAEITPCESTEDAIENSVPSVWLQLCKGTSAEYDDVYFISLLEYGSEYRISSSDDMRENGGIYGKVKSSDAEKIRSAAKETLENSKKIPPVLGITDPLSSQFISGPLVSYSGASWSFTDENGKASGFQADSVSPLDKNAILPEVSLYTDMCLVNFGEEPDRIILNGYSVSDIGNMNAEKTVSIEKDGSDGLSAGFLELEKNTVYSLTAFWDEDRYDERGFSGSAEYQFKTGKNIKEPSADNQLESMPYPPDITVFSGDNKNIRLRYAGCSWNYSLGGGMASGAEACPPHPLDSAVTLTEIPLYNRYTEFSFGDHRPDKFTLVAYDASDIGNTLADTKFVQNGYFTETAADNTGLIFSLTEDTVYWLTAVWDDDKFDERGFSGSADYYFRSAENITSDEALTDNFVSPDIKYVKVSRGEQVSETSDFEALLKAMREGEYTRRSRFPEGEITASTKMYFYADTHNYIAYSFFECEGKYYFDIITTNSINVYETSRDAYDKIIEECDKILENGTEITD